MIGRENELRGYRDRAKVILAFVFLILVGISYRLFYLQIVIGEELYRYSAANHLKKEKVFPTRGIIFDRNGKVIVDNRASFDVVVISQFYPFKEKLNVRLANVLQIPLEELEKRLQRAKRNPPFFPTLIKADVDKDIIAAIEMDPEGYPGIDIEATARRKYPYGRLAAQLLGYVGEVNKKEIARYPQKKLVSGDYIGKVGLEKTYDKSLRGVDGVGYVEVDARGRRQQREKGEQLLGFSAYKEPLPGDNLHLTIDIDLELEAIAAMQEGPYLGAVVALDPRSGEVLAMASEPSYEPDTISGRQVKAKVWGRLSQDENRPLRNRTIQDHYPPGSTFKTILALAGLEEKIVKPEHSVNCNGKMRFGRRTFHCWKRHGVMDLYGAIRESCDIYFYKLGIDLGVDGIAKYARMFGFGSKSGINLSSEQRGLIPDKAWKKKTYNDIWHPGETLSVAIGQGYVNATPLQVALAYSAIGNLGFLYRPYVVQRIEGRGGQIIQQYRPELIRKIDISSDAFAIVKEGLMQVVHDKKGTAGRARSRISHISGKTGTSQVRRFKNIISKKCENMEYKDKHHGLFVGYAPQENPEITVAVVGEHICSSKYAAGVARRVIDKYFEKKQKLNEPTQTTPIGTDRNIARDGEEKRESR